MFKLSKSDNLHIQVEARTITVDTQHASTLWIMHQAYLLAINWVIIKTEQYKTKKHADSQGRRRQDTKDIKVSNMIKCDFGSDAYNS